MSLYFKIFGVVLVALLIFGYVYLKDYQDNLPADAGTRVMNAIQANDTATLDTMSSNFPVSLRESAIFTKYMAAFGTQDLYFYEGTSKIANQVVFIFVDNNLKMATLTLEKTGKKSLFGFDHYKVLDLVFKPLHTYTIINTTAFDVLVNGLSIDEQVQDLKEAQHHAFAEDIFGALPVKTYTFADFMYIDTVTVKDHPEVQISYNETTETYTVFARSAESVQTAITDFGEKVIKAHTRLLSIPYINRYTFLDEFAYPNSDFAKTVKSYDLTVRYPFISESFADLTVGNIIQYGPHEYSVDASLSYTWTATWYGVVKTRTTKPAYTFYITDINGFWQVTDMTLTATE